MTHYVSEIKIYPIKGMSGIALEESLALKTGFYLDRNWMVIDHAGNMVTQRTYPKLCMFQVKLEKKFITITYEHEQLTFFKDHFYSKTIKTKVWDDDAMVYEVDSFVSTWLSDRLNSPVKLVKIKDSQSRMHLCKEKDLTIPVSLADGYPYLLFGNKSLHHLNAKLEVPIMGDRFRPNIVITSSHPHEEDSLDVFSVGQAQFQNLKPCARCMVVNIDPLSGIFTPEPLKTLGAYRKFDNKVNFGTNLTCIKEGMVSIGDPIKAIL